MTYISSKILIKVLFLQRVSKQFSMPIYFLLKKKGSAVFTNILNMLHNVPCEHFVNKFLFFFSEFYIEIVFNVL